MRRRVGIQARPRVPEDLDEPECDDDDAAVHRAPNDLTQQAVKNQCPVEVTRAKHRIGLDVTPKSIGEFLERLGWKFALWVKRRLQLLIERLRVVLVQEPLGKSRAVGLQALERVP